MIDLFEEGNGGKEELKDLPYYLSILFQNADGEEPDLASQSEAVKTIIQGLDAYSLPENYLDRFLHLYERCENEALRCSFGEILIRKCIE